MDIRLTLELFLIGALGVLSLAFSPMRLSGLLSGVLILAAALGTRAAAETIEELTAAAATGAGDAQLAVALAYDEGKVVKRNPRLAADWYQKAADQGIGVAELQLGYFAEKGQGLGQSFDDARAHYERAIGLGCAAAGLQLGLMDIEGWGGPRDLAEAARLIGAAAKSGDPIAQRVYGGMYFSGFAVSRDLEQALYWEEEAAKTDSAEAEIGVGNVLRRIHAQDKDAAIGRTWYQLSASQDYSRGMRAMADSFLGQGATMEQISMGRKWLELAAEAGDAQAELRLAILYVRYPGYNRQADLQQKAYRLLEQARRQRVPAALHAIEYIGYGHTLAEAVRYIGVVPAPQQFMELAATKASLLGSDESGATLPVPIRMAHAKYPPAMLLTRTDGLVWVGYTVDATGKVSEAHAISSTHPGFSAAAVEAVQRWEFLPASRNGQAVAVSRKVSMAFSAPIGPVDAKRLDTAGQPASPLIEKAAPGAYDAKLKLAESLDNARNWMWDGKMDLAVAELNSALAANPTAWTAHLMRGRAEMSLGQMAAAKADFDAAAELSPKAEPPVNSRGIWNHAVGNLEAALADYDQSIKMASGTSAHLWILRSLVLRKLNRPNPAAEMAAQQPKWGAAWTSQLASYLLGQLTEDELLKRAGEGDPDTVPVRLAEAYYYVGADLLLKAQPDLARQHFESCLALNQTNLTVWPLATAELSALHSRSD
jgi:TonB family protein